jgi:hypothetical protein
MLFYCGRLSSTSEATFTDFKHVLTEHLPKVTAWLIFSLLKVFNMGLKSRFSSFLIVIFTEVFSSKPNRLQFVLLCHKLKHNFILFSSHTHPTLFPGSNGEQSIQFFPSVSTNWTFFIYFLFLIGIYHPLLLIFPSPV